MFKYFPFIARNALRNRRRSVLTIISVAISLCLLGILLAIYQGFFHPDDTSPAQARRLVVHHRVSLAQSMPGAYKSDILKVGMIDGITSWQWFGGVYKNDRPENFFARLGVDPVEFYRVRPETQMPADQREAFIKTPAGAIASVQLADAMKWKLGERIHIVGDIYPVTLDLTLVGIFSDPDRTKVLFYNNYYLQELLINDPAQRDTASSFLVLVDTPEHVPRVAKSIDALFDNHPAPTKSESEKDFALSFLAFLGNVKLFLAAISGAVMFTILLVSANTVAMTVRERIRETAILRTLGFTPTEVCGLILGEAGFLSFIGGIFGCMLAGVACVGLHNSGSQFNFPLLKPAMALLVVVAAIVIGLLSAAMPAWFASRRHVVDSMRFAG